MLYTLNQPSVRPPHVDVVVRDEMPDRRRCGQVDLFPRIAYDNDVWDAHILLGVSAA